MKALGFIAMRSLLCPALLVMVSPLLAAQETSDAACTTVSAAQDSCALPVQTAAAEACCEVAPGTQSTASAAEAPWVGAELRNRFDPINGEQTDSEFFLPFSDAETGVYARIYFSTESSLETGKKQNARELYARAYLTQSDGTKLPYGSTRLSVDNTMCPVSSVGADAKSLLNPLLEFDAVLSVNCTAGSCSVGDAFIAHYNAISIHVCCPTCAKQFGNAPAKHLRNIWSDIDAALSAAAGADS